MRWMFAAEARGALPKGTARRWAAHTTDMNKLPEKTDTDTEKKAFVAAFVIKCAAAGITSPGAVVDAARRATAAIKAASAGSVVGDVAGGLTGTALLGSVGLPAAAGALVGAGAGMMVNQTDVDDAKVLRLRAEANAYRRRAALAVANEKVRKLVNNSPGNYVVVS